MQQKACEDLCAILQRHRLLSIIALAFPQTNLPDLFQCSKSTVTAARVHRFLFGRGGVKPASLKFSHQCVSQAVLNQFVDFLIRDDVSRHLPVEVDGAQECPVIYWQDSIKQVIKQYLVEFKGNVKKSFIYAHIPKNFQSNTMLAGLYNLCEDLGFFKFCKPEGHGPRLGADSLHENLGSVTKSITLLQRYVKTKFSHQVFIISS